MRGLVVGLLLALLVAASAQAADPLRGGRPPAAAASEASAPAAGGNWLAALARWQRELNAQISRAFRELRSSGSPAALASLLGVAFLYGVAHAAGPGHGKMVVAAYLTARRDTWLTGIGIGGLISALQGLVAVLGVGVLGWMLSITSRQVQDSAVPVELVSYLLIALIGGVMLWRAATGRHHEGHHHGPHEHVHHRDHHHRHAPARQDWQFILAAGLTPCASAIIIMLFALANEAFWLGALAVAALSLGMGGTVATIGVVTVLARDVARRAFAAGGARGELIERVMLMLGSFLLLLFGGVLALGAWARL